MSQSSSVPAPRSGAAASGLMAVLLSGIVYASFHLAPLPQKTPASAPAGQFSSERAIQYVEQIAKEPHPAGTAQNAAVADYLQRQLSLLGVEPQLQEATYVEGRGVYLVGTIRNVLARLRGTAPGKALLLIAHYDSPSTSPGAADDGAGVAALLETLRALRSGPPLKNDIIFLFTDAEEAGQWGAKLFWTEHPWAKDTGVAVNFEARGASGPSMLFETGNGEGWLVRRFAKTAPHPYAASVMPALYKVLPNRTDLTVFKQAGLPVMNFAFAETWTSYHTALDRAGSLSLRSLQHHGSHALALARDLGNADLSHPGREGAVYFNVAGSVMIAYSRMWAGVLTVLLAALFLAVAIRGRVLRQVTGRGLAFGFVALGIAIAVAGLAASGLMILIPKLTGSKDWTVVYHMDLYVLGVAALSACLTTLCYLWFATRTRAENLLLGGLLWFLLLAVITSTFVPGASYLLAWPLLYGLILAALMQTGTFSRLGPLARAGVLAAAALPPLMLLVPSIWLLYVAFTTPGVFFVAIATPLCLALLIPHLRLMAAPRPWALPAALGALSLAFIGVASFRVATDNSHPKQDHVFYVADLDKKSAVWASSNIAVDQWTSQFFPQVSEKKPLGAHIPAWYGTPFIREGRFMMGDAPLLPSSSADVSLLEDATHAGMRTITVAVRSPARAPHVSVHLQTGGPILRAAFTTAPALGPAASEKHPRTFVLFDHTGTPKNELNMTYSGMPAEGARITIETAGAPLTGAQVIEYSYRLPDLAGTGLRERPAGVIQNKFPGDASIVGRSFVFPDRSSMGAAGAPLRAHLSRSAADRRQAERR